MPKLLFLSGSIRTDSLNTKLAKAAMQQATELGAKTTYLDLKDYELPIYNGDLEAASGLPDNAKKIKELFVEHDGFFIASPEYNGSFSALLKNTIDWISRPHTDNEPPLHAFKGKIAALSACSPGALGGLRGLVPLRMLLGNIGVIVSPSQAAIGNGFKAFDETGNLTDNKQDELLNKVVSEFVNLSK